MHKLIIFLISATGVFASLYFSEILKLPPCSLCWYQRIFLYPLTLITIVDILKNRHKDYDLELIFSVIGFVIAAYHNLIYFGIIEDIVPCSQGVPCTARQIEWFGFITIPLLSLVGFLSIIVVILTNYFFKRFKSDVNK